MRQQTIKNILRTSRFVLCLSLSAVPVLALPETGADKSESVPANAGLMVVPSLFTMPLMAFTLGSVSENDVRYVELS